MRSLKLFLCLFAFATISRPEPSWARVQQGQGQGQGPGPAEASASEGISLPAGTALSVRVGKSVVVHSPETLKRVSVTDASIASAMIVSPNQVLIHGEVPGAVTLMLWDENEKSRSYDLTVDIDMAALRQTMQQVFPGESIEVAQTGSSIVLSGAVTSKAVAERATALAQSQTKNVVNMMQTSDGKEVVLLQVKFAEVDRAAIRQLGVNFFSTGAGNTIGSVTTQQFGGLVTNTGAIPSGVTRGRDPQTPSITSGGIGNILNATPAVFGLTDLLNLFLFRPDLNLGVAIRALQQKNLLQILAEPNVLALNNTESSFLAGGEFPFPVLQGGAYNAVTIEFKEFGVRLKFKPMIQPDGKIRLKVAPEVSALDFSNGLTVSGFVIPALSTRRAETEVELNDGQSFAIAGLMDNRMSKISSRIPGLAHIPVIGTFFKSDSQNKTNTELLVMVTPRLVRPMNPNELPPMPQFPKDFLQPDQFDEHKKATQPTKKSQTNPSKNQATPKADKAKPDVKNEGAPHARTGVHVPENQ